METLTKAEKTIKQIAALLGLLQGAAWMVMSILCIIMYNLPLEYISISSYMDQICVAIYAFYLSNDGFALIGQQITPSAFTIFMWVYLFIDIFWILASLFALCTKNRKVKKSLQIWCIITSFVCTLDVILVILLGVDYQNCKSPRTSNIQEMLVIEEVCANGILPVLVIAAKGFVLWIVNLSFAITLIKISRNLTENTEPKQIEPIYIYPTTSFNSNNGTAPQSPIYSQVAYPHPNGFQSNVPPLSQPQLNAQGLAGAHYTQYPPPSSMPFSPTRESYSDFSRFQGTVQPNQNQRPFVLKTPPKRK